LLGNNIELKWIAVKLLLILNQKGSFYFLISTDMADFKQAFDKLIIDEGGYTPDDCGSEGYKGIRRGNWNKWPGWTVIDNLKHTGRFSDDLLSQNKELQNLVVSFYYDEFWALVRGDEIKSQRIAESIFNFSVNAYFTTAIKLAQKALKIESDGIIGANTLYALNNIDEYYFCSEFTIEKIKRYIEIIKAEPLKEKYFLNWICRCLKYS
jgi:lysozyme family protein